MMRPDRLDLPGQRSVVQPGVFHHLVTQLGLLAQVIGHRAPRSAVAGKLGLQLFALDAQPLEHFGGGHDRIWPGRDVQYPFIDKVDPSRGQRLFDATHLHPLLIDCGKEVSIDDVFAEQIANLDIINLTPVEALNKLNDIQKIIGIKK